MTVVMIFSFIMAIGIFMLLPMFISNICKKVIPSHTVMAILEGFIRIAIFRYLYKNGIPHGRY